ncbi:MAG TPA: DinB family protein [Chloroflexia bacterium]|nr:DinB family protein [Chloroflexia bacterium]
MTQIQPSLTPFYKGWDIFHQHLVAAIAPLIPEQLALRSAPQNYSIGMIATHIVGARVFWFYTWMGERSVDLASYEVWNFQVREDGLDPLHLPEELIRGLEKSWQIIQNTLAHRTPADLDLLYPDPYPDPNEVDNSARSLQWIIWHTLEHDIQHGGELSSILSVNGLPTIDLG